MGALFRSGFFRVLSALVGKLSTQALEWGFHGPPVWLRGPDSGVGQNWGRVGAGQFLLAQPPWVGSTPSLQPSPYSHPSWDVASLAWGTPWSGGVVGQSL